MRRALAVAAAGAAVGAAAAGSGLLVLAGLRQIDDAFDVPLDAPDTPDLLAHRLWRAAAIPTPRSAA